jgi:hypothetical protein
MKEEAGKAAGEASKCSWTCERCTCGCCMYVSKATCMHAEKQQPPGGEGVRAQEGNPSITASPPRRLAASPPHGFRLLASFVFDRIGCVSRCCGLPRSALRQTNQPLRELPFKDAASHVLCFCILTKTQAYNFLDFMDGIWAKKSLGHGPWESRRRSVE